MSETAPCRICGVVGGHLVICKRARTPEQELPHDSGTHTTSCYYVYGQGWRCTENCESGIAKLKRMRTPAPEPVPQEAEPDRCKECGDIHDSPSDYCSMTCVARAALRVAREVGGEREPERGASDLLNEIYRRMEETPRALAAPAAAPVEGLREAAAVLLEEGEKLNATHENGAWACGFAAGVLLRRASLASPSPAPSGMEEAVAHLSRVLSAGHEERMEAARYLARMRASAPAPEPAVEALTFERMVAMSDTELVEGIRSTLAPEPWDGDKRRVATAYSLATEMKRRLATPDRERERRAMRDAFHAGMDYEADEFSPGFDAWFARYPQSQTQDSETT